MKKTTLFALLLIVLLLLTKLTFAAPSPDDYPINVHVSSSRYAPVSTGNVEIVSVTINGKKYELSDGYVGSLLSLGDYKAKLLKDEHRTPYESFQVYEFLFPDGKTRKFSVTGQFE
jgi:hypothetical protein